MACNAQGQGTIKVVERTRPSRSVRMMASFVELHIPKSSALIINRRASAGYPSNRFVWFLLNGFIFPISFQESTGECLKGVGVSQLLDHFLIHTDGPQLWQKLVCEVGVRFGNAAVRQCRVIPSPVMTQQQFTTQASV